MKIATVRHRGLRRFIGNDDRSGLPDVVVEKLRRMISFLQDMESESELRVVPSWRAHQMSGDRKGSWSLFVTRNWRLTFLVDAAADEIRNLDFEDYH